MIRSLKRRFLITAMCSVIAVLTVLMVLINFWNYRNIVTGADDLLEILAEGEGSFFQAPSFAALGFSEAESSADDSGSSAAESRGAGDVFAAGQNDAAKAAASPDAQTPPDPPDGETPADPDSLTITFAESHSLFYPFDQTNRFTTETPYETRYFFVRFDTEGNLTDVNTGQIAAVSQKDAREIASSLLDSSSASGFYSFYRYLIHKDEAGTLVLFIDCSRDLATCRSFLISCILVSLLGTVSVFFLMLFFSTLIFRPVEESYAKQKRFITDASHELKTPLTIIDANTEIIEMTSEANEWTESIHHQVERLRSMTEKLVSLSRMEEENRKVTMTEFSLSDAVSESAAPFGPAAESRGLHLTVSVEPQLSYTGEEAAIRQLVSILLDNAVKYTDPEGTIALSLKSRGHGHGAELTVSNPSAGLTRGDHKNFFDRFSRADASRNSEIKGFGIGLSLALSIVLEHKGKITAKSPEDGQFVITALL